MGGRRFLAALAISMLAGSRLWAGPADEVASALPGGEKVATDLLTAGLAEMAAPEIYDVAEILQMQKQFGQSKLAYDTLIERFPQDENTPKASFESSRIGVIIGGWWEEDLPKLKAVAEKYPQNEFGQEAGATTRP